MKNAWNKDGDKEFYYILKQFWKIYFLSYLIRKLKKKTYNL